MKYLYTGFSYSTYVDLLLNIYCSEISTAKSRPVIERALLPRIYLWFQFPFMYSIKLNKDQITRMKHRENFINFPLGRPNSQSASEFVFMVRKGKEGVRAPIVQREREVEDYSLESQTLHKT